MERPAFTLGVEEEFQIIDPETRELRSHVQEILDEGKLVLKERVKPEMHQSVIEIGTGICKNIQEVRADVGEMRTEIIRLAKKNGMRVGAAGTHPFSNWADQKIFPDPRYDKVVEEMQLLARANLIFGLHVHVGIKDRNLAFQIMNEALYFLPHLLALSTNSPFWLGRNTGLKSFRTKSNTCPALGPLVQFSIANWAGRRTASPARAARRCAWRPEEITPHTIGDNP